MTFLPRLHILHGNDDGDVLVEYALILAVLSLAAITALSIMGPFATNAMQTTSTTQLQYQGESPF